MKINVSPRRIQWGIYAGLPFTRLPDQYLIWAYQQEWMQSDVSIHMQPCKERLAEEINRRWPGSPLLPPVAIDYPERTTEVTYFWGETRNSKGCDI